jgi:hypothetical protein
MVTQENVALANHLFAEAISRYSLDSGVPSFTRTAALP